MSSTIQTVGSPAGALGDVRAWVTERHGGVSPAPYDSLNVGTHTDDDVANVEENERRVRTSLGLGRLAKVRLVHGARAVTTREEGHHGEADALLTDDSSLALGITVADCYPVAFAAPGWKGLAHCGWRSVAAGLVEVMVKSLANSGVPAPEVSAWIGPGIGPCCFEVGEEVAQQFAPQHIRTTDGPRPHLDLAAEIFGRLQQAGVDENRITRSELCTACNTDRLFSHRKEAPTGRMGAYVL